MKKITTRKNKYGVDTVQINVTIKHETWKRLSEICKNLNFSMSYVVNKVLEEYVSKK